MPEEPVWLWGTAELEGGKLIGWQENHSTDWLGQWASRKKKAQANTGCTHKKRPPPQKKKRKTKGKKRIGIFVHVEKNRTSFHHINLHICSIFPNQKIQKAAFAFKPLCMIYIKNNIYMGNNQRPGMGWLGVLHTSPHKQSLLPVKGQSERWQENGSLCHTTFQDLKQFQMKGWISKM